MISGSPRLFSSPKCKALVAEPSASYIFRGHEFCRQCSTIPTQKAHTPAYAPRSISVVTQFPSFLFLLGGLSPIVVAVCLRIKNLANALGGVLSEPDTLGQKQRCRFSFLLSSFREGGSVGSFSGLWAAMKLSVGISYLDLPFLYSDHGLYEIHILRTYWLTHDSLCYCCYCRRS